MAKSRENKSEEVLKLVPVLKTAKGAVLADFTGLNVKDTQELRKNLRQQGISYTVIKKSLLQRALTEVGLSDISVKSFKNSVSVAVSANDEVEPAKLLVAFAKTHEQIKVLGGLLENKFIEPAKVMELSALPGKTVLLAKLVGSLQSPITGLVNVLQGNLRGLVQVLHALASKQ